MVINSNDSDNATAFEVTDAPHSTVVVKSGRIPYNHRKQVLNLAAWNVRTTNDSADSCRPERATAIISRELATANIDICAISEVRHEGTGNIVEKEITPSTGVEATRKKLVLVSQFPMAYQTLPLI